jgi:hypothetical protein
MRGVRQFKKKVDKTAPVLILQRRLPVRHDRDRLARCWLGGTQDQKAPAIVHRLPERAQAVHRCGFQREQRLRSSSGKLRAVPVDFNGHQRVVWCAVVQFFSVRSPLREEASARGDALPGTGLRKGLDVHFVGAGVVRHKRQPAAVGRRRGGVLIELGVRKRNRIAAARWDRPDVGLTDRRRWA